MAKENGEQLDGNAIYSDRHSEGEAIYNVPWVAA